jgi:hypothetical protein
VRRVSVLLFLLIVAVLPGCPHEPAANRTSAVKPQPVSTSTQRVPDELRELVRAVREVPAAADDASHAKIVSALSLLAELIRRDDAAAAAAIEHRATRLMRSPPYERQHADVAKQALSTALESYAAHMSRTPKAQVQHAFASAQRSLERISAAEPLRFQVEEVAAVLRSLANLAAFDRNLDPVFTPVYEEADVGYRPAELRDRVEKASNLITALAMEHYTGRAGARAASALDALADAVEVSPLDLEPGKWQALVSAIRYEAIELARESSISLDRSDRIKAGLLACVRALRSLSRSQNTSSSLVSTAAAAVKAIDDHTSLAFQRARVQEAFRVVIDVLWQEVQS